MKRALVAVSSLALVAAGLGVGAPAVTRARAQVDGPPVFAQVGVAQQTVGGEPGIWVDPLSSPPMVYTVEPQSGTPVWRSNDAGQTFTSVPVVTSGGGGDSDVVTDADGTVYVSDLLSGSGVLDTTIPVSTSFDHGQSFDHVVALAPDASGVVWDRQWSAAQGHGHVVVSARMTAGPYSAWVSTDHARTFAGPFTIDNNVDTGGPIVFTRDGSTLYTAYGKTFNGQEDVRYGKSIDGGKTWTTGHIAFIASNTPGFIVPDVDDAGNVYVTWSVQHGVDGTPYGSVNAPVLLSVSTNAGATWRTPIDLSGSTHTALFPWVVAGEAGRVNVAWYEANDPVNDLGPDLGKPTTTWDIVMAQSLDATATTPTFTKQVVVSDFHTGSICTVGLECVGPQNAGLVNAPTPSDRRVLDFFEMALDPNGNVLIAYPKDRPATTGNYADVVESTTDLVVARQVDGSRLRTAPLVVYPTHADLAPCAPFLFTDAAGDEVYAYDVTSNHWPQLDLIGGQMAMSGTNLVVTLTVTNFSTDVPAPGVENDYYATWLFRGTRYFANATVNRQGTATFSDGIVGNSIPTRHQLHAVTGSFAAGPGGTIQIVVPLANIGNPPPAEVLQQPSAESDVYTGSPVHGVTPVSGLLKQVDTAGPGHDYAVGQVC